MSVNSPNVEALELLAGRCEGASAEEQGLLLEMAWDALAEHSDEFRRFALTSPESGFDNNAAKFGMALEAMAYESAALMLVPEDMRDEIEITTLYCVARVTINMNHGPNGSPFYGNNACNLISMAVAHASLRARAHLLSEPADKDTSDAE